MKRLEYIFIMFAAILLTTSCSKDDLLPDGSTDAPVTGQTQTYTFTVSPDITMKGDARTRSEGTQEEMPTRCFMQIFGNNVNLDVQKGESIDNGSFTFSVKLPNMAYTFLFWADNADNVSENPPTNLRAIQYTPGTVAFAAREEGTPKEVGNKEISLKHAVTKLSLQTTEATSASEGESIKVTTTCATTYNVDNPSASSYSKQTAMKTFDTPTDFAANSNIATFYFIPTDEAQDVDVEFHLLKQTIQNISLAANSHITLQGDLSENNPKWGATSEYAQKQINYFFKQKDGTTSEGTLNGGVYRFYLPEENITDLEAVLSAIFHKNVKLDLTGIYIIFEEVLDNDYTFIIKNNPTSASRCLDILINNNKTYAIYYNPVYDGLFTNFSVVSNKLKNQTE